jgi:hypothetical protein
MADLQRQYGQWGPTVLSPMMSLSRRERRERQRELDAQREGGRAVDMLGRFLGEQATDEARRRRRRLLTSVQRLMWARTMLPLAEGACINSAGDSNPVVPPNLDLIRGVGESALLSAAR